MGFRSFNNILLSFNKSISKLFLIYTFCFILPVHATMKPEHIIGEKWDQLNQTIQQELQMGQTNYQFIGSRDGQLGQFGAEVKISGNTALVSATIDSDNGKASGAVYIYKLESGQWLYKNKLKAADGKPFDLFGRSVSIDETGSTVVIGTNAAVYVFEKACARCDYQQTDKLFDNSLQSFGIDVEVGNGHIIIRNTNQLNFYLKDPHGDWELIQKIALSTSTLSQSISLFDNRLLAGNPYDNTNGIDAGAVVVYDFAGGKWSEIFKILAPDNGQTGARFGSSLKFSGNRAIISAQNENNNTGSAYIIEFPTNGINGWIKLTDNNGSAGDLFGSNVSLFNDIAVVSASGTGMSYIYDFTNNQWELSDSISAPTNLQVPVTDQNFDSIIIGHTSFSGAYGLVDIYKFIQGNWEVDSTLQFDENEGDEFGIAISFSGNRVVISAYTDAKKGLNAGAVLVYGYIANQWKKIKKLVAENGF